jgi:serine/threonine protein kinase
MEMFFRKSFVTKKTGLILKSVRFGNYSFKLSGDYTQTGTPYYASPEVWKDEPYD